MSVYTRIHTYAHYLFSTMQHSQTWPGKYNKLITCGSSNAKAEQHATEDGNSPEEEQTGADDVLWSDALRQSLSKMHNHTHGLDQRVEEELAMWVELGGVAPVQQDQCLISMLHAP
jgi:hypothetical protein